MFERDNNGVISLTFSEREHTVNPCWKLLFCTLIFLYGLLLLSLIQWAAVAALRGM